ncbi:Non-catalytic module family DOC2, partial [Piromyces sp. E2]
CAAADQGYACCSSWNTAVIYQDETGDWGVENGDWCGITQKKCWSEPLGFPCCSACSDPVYTDDDGNWGVENGNWCGL